MGQGHDDDSERRSCGFCFFLREAAGALN